MAVTYADFWINLVITTMGYRMAKQRNVSLDIRGQIFATGFCHGVTASILLCIGVLLTAAWMLSLRMTLALVVVIHYGFYTALFLLYPVVLFQSVVVMPQWVGFLLTIVVASIGLWQGINNRTIGVY